MEKYKIDYKNGVVDFFNTDKGLESVKEFADDNITYTQCDCVIEDANGNELCRRKWYGVPYDHEADTEDDPILFDAFGFYADWIESVDACRRG
jgi:hypothetical protein